MGVVSTPGYLWNNGHNLVTPVAKGLQNMANVCKWTTHRYLKAIKISLLKYLGNPKGVATITPW